MSETNSKNVENEKVLLSETIRTIAEYENYSDLQILDLEASLKELSLLLYQVTTKDKSHKQAL